MPGSDGNEANGNKQFIIQPIFFRSGCLSLYAILCALHDDVVGVLHKQFEFIQRFERDSVHFSIFTSLNWQFFRAIFMTPMNKKKSIKCFFFLVVKITFFSDIIDTIFFSVAEIIGFGKINKEIKNMALK